MVTSRWYRRNRRTAIRGAPATPHTGATRPPATSALTTSAPRRCWAFADIVIETRTIIRRIRMGSIIPNGVACSAFAASACPCVIRNRVTVMMRRPARTFSRRGRAQAVGAFAATRLEFQNSRHLADMRAIQSNLLLHRSQHRCSDVGRRHYYGQKAKPKRSSL